MTTEIRNWGDDQQYDAEPHGSSGADGGVVPKVTLLTMTERPLAVLAAFCAIYEGRVVRGLDEVSKEQMTKALSDVQQTHLKAPLESVKLHFLLEGVDRAFTHQLVRQRTAVYGQESMRFAVLGDLEDATTLPPSIAASPRSANVNKSLTLTELRNSPEFSYMPAEERQRAIWDYAVRAIDEAYHALVNGRVPAEDARGLLPHATATRIHFITDMRNLSDHAGNRLCTQAQFAWRSVFSQMVNEIRNYTPSTKYITNGNANVVAGLEWEDEFRWQYKALADSGLFRPACYQQGKCPFQASFDRACSIRERVDKFAEHNVPSDRWAYPLDDHSGVGRGRIAGPINPAEWVMDPSAARVVS